MPPNYAVPRCMVSEPRVEPGMDAWETLALLSGWVGAYKDA